VQIGVHLSNRHITVPLGRVLFGQAIHPLDHAVGLRRIRQRRPMLDVLLSTDLLKGMVVLDLRAPAVLEAFQGELTPVVRQDLADLKREERKALPQKVCGGLLVLVFIDRKKRQSRGPVNGDEAVATKQ